MTPPRCFWRQSFVRTLLDRDIPQLEQLIASVDLHGTYFWATHGGVELDLLVIAGGKRYGFEFKYADAPGTTRSMRIAMPDLNLTQLPVVYPGDVAYDLDERISVLPVADLRTVASTLGV